MENNFREISDNLEKIKNAYIHLQALSGGCDSENVGMVLDVINDQFEHTLKKLEQLRGKDTV